MEKKFTITAEMSVTGTLSINIANDGYSDLELMGLARIIATDVLYPLERGDSTKLRHPEPVQPATPVVEG